MPRDNEHNPDPNANASRIVRESTAEADRLPEDVEAAWSSQIQNVDECTRKSCLGRRLRLDGMQERAPKLWLALWLALFFWRRLPLEAFFEPPLWLVGPRQHTG